jgi:hypothetical protein
MPHAHHLKVEVFKEDDHWEGFPIDAPGSMAGGTLPEFFADVEFSKHFCLWVPNLVPISVEYVAGQPEIAEELSTAYAAFLALLPHLRPRAVAWDHDNDRPVDPTHTGPYLNLEQMSAYI